MKRHLSGGWNLPEASENVAHVRRIFQQSELVQRQFLPVGPSWNDQETGGDEKGGENDISGDTDCAAQTMVRDERSWKKSKLLESGTRLSITVELRENELSFAVYLRRYSTNWKDRASESTSAHN